MTSEYSIRHARPDDYDALVEFRLAMFREMGWTDDKRLQRLAPAYRTYLAEGERDGSILLWVAERDGRIEGGIGLLWDRVPPTVRNLDGTHAYLFALYVRPECRGTGMGRALADVAVAAAREGGVGVVALHTSHEGRALYERMGFVESPELRLFTDPTSAAWTVEHGPDDEWER